MGDTGGDRRWARWGHGEEDTGAQWLNDDLTMGDRSSVGDGLREDKPSSRQVEFKELQTISWVMYKKTQ